MSDERVTIGSYEFVAEAEVAQMFLRENGIDATLREDGVVGMNWLLANAVGYVKVQVPREQVSAAEELLAALPGRTKANRGRAVAAGPVCRSCGLALGNELEECPACGEAAMDEEPAEVQGESAEEETEEEESARGVMGRVRSLKKPIFWLLLWPVIFFVLLVARALVEMVLEGTRS